MSPESIDLDKSKLRAEFREKRREIAEQTRLRNDQQIGQRLEALTAQKQASAIAGYLAFDGEPDISQALARINEGVAEVSLPVITASVSEASLIFRRWLPENGAGLHRNSFGIEEPVIGPQVAASDLDIIFLPLVAWDPSGGRLGMGVGYYDRALACVADVPHPLRIGIAYHAQCAPALPMTELDVRLHGVITEKGLQICNELLAV